MSVVYANLFPGSSEQRLAGRDFAAVSQFSKILSIGHFSSRSAAFYEMLSTSKSSRRRRVAIAKLL
ncbi:hypothetical protein, partial [Candidatus Raskinella chloraquaticus]|uniref:hypothetical protein n=1 Tax=Candidatus Raskinella chloraquaticus TaxID=1951219 RepID=UPI00366D7006